MKAKHSYFILPFVIALFVTSCKTNNYLKYHRLVNEAHYSYHNAYLDTARIYFEKAFKKVKIPFDRDLIYYSACLWEVGEKEDAIEILDTNLFTSTFLYPNYAFLDMSDSMKTAIKDRNRKFIDNKTQLFQSTSLYKLVDFLDSEDRRIRSKWKVISESYNGDSSEIKNCLDSMRIIDNYNLEVLDSIFKINGYLGGVNWFDTRQLHYIMIHSNEKWLLDNRKFFLSELKKGHILPIEFAIPIDRLLYHDKQLPEYYGQYFKDIGSMNPKDYFEHANSIGLSPYFLYSDRFPNARSIPKTTPFYEYYKERKSRFKCI
jgi:hypothetical protein